MLQDPVVSIKNLDGHHGTSKLIPKHPSLLLQLQSLTFVHHLCKGWRLHCGVHKFGGHRMLRLKLVEDGPPNRPICHESLMCIGPMGLSHADLPAE